jgi:hypothetical protein
MKWARLSRGARRKPKGARPRCDSRIAVPAREASSARASGGDDRAPGSSRTATNARRWRRAREPRERPRRRPDVGMRAYRCGPVARTWPLSAPRWRQGGGERAAHASRAAGPGRMHRLSSPRRRATSAPGSDVPDESLAMEAVHRSDCCWQLRDDVTSALGPASPSGLTQNAESSVGETGADDLPAGGMSARIIGPPQASAVGHLWDWRRRGITRRRRRG